MDAHELEEVYREVANVYSTVRGHAADTLQIVRPRGVQSHKNG